MTRTVISRRKDENSTIGDVFAVASLLSDPSKLSDGQSTSFATSSHTGVSEASDGLGEVCEVRRHRWRLAPRPATTAAMSSNTESIASETNRFYKKKSERLSLQLQMVRKASDKGLAVAEATVSDHRKPLSKAGKLEILRAFLDNYSDTEDVYALVKAAQSQAAQSQAAQSQAAQSQAAQSQAAESQAAESQAAESQAAESQAAQSQAAQLEHRPVLIRPHIMTDESFIAWKEALLVNEHKTPFEERAVQSTIKASKLMVSDLKRSFTRLHLGGSYCAGLVMVSDFLPSSQAFIKVLSLNPTESAGSKSSAKGRKPACSIAMIDLFVHPDDEAALLTMSKETLVAKMNEEIKLARYTSIGVDPSVAEGLRSNLPNRFYMSRAKNTPFKSLLSLHLGAEDVPRRKTVMSRIQKFFF